MYLIVAFHRFGARPKSQTFHTILDNLAGCGFSRKNFAVLSWWPDRKAVFPLINLATSWWIFLIILYFCCSKVSRTKSSLPWENSPILRSVASTSVAFAGLKGTAIDAQDFELRLASTYPMVRADLLVEGGIAAALALVAAAVVARPTFITPEMIKH